MYVCMYYELSVVCVIIMNKCKQERAAVHCHWWPTQTKFSVSPEFNGQGRIYIIHGSSRLSLIWMGL